MRAPLMLIVARARRRPLRWLLPALGIALAAAFAVGLAAEGVIAGDQSAKSVLAGTSPLARTVRVTWQGAVTAGVERRARGLLRGLGLGPQTEVLLLNPVRLSGVIVRPVAISPLEQWLPRTAVDRLGHCRASDCPLLLAGGGHVPATLSAAGVRITVVGSAALRSAVPLAFAPSIDGQWPVLVTGDVAGLGALPGLSGVYRDRSWLATLPAGRLHSWELAGVQARMASAQASLLASGGQFSLTAPFAALDAARAQVGAANQRLLLIGGGAAAALALFVILAAGSLRGEQRAELERLRAAGARLGHSVAFVVGEAAWLCAAALLAGTGIGILAGVALAGAAGEPTGAVLAHSIGTLGALLILVGVWAVGVSLIAISTLARGGRLADVLALVAACVLVSGLAIGGSGDRAWTLLLAPVCCLAAGVVIYRAAEWLLRALERIARRGPVLTRLALVSLARAPAAPSLAIAFVAVSVGLGGFAIAYRATLLRGTADQAANQVPLDALVSAGPNFVTPLETATLARWRALAGGAVLPVRRTFATYAGTEGSVTVPALGVPAGGLRLIHGWRTSDGTASLSALARRLRGPGPVRVPGPLLPAQARWLSLPAVSPAVTVSVIADLRDPGGAVTQLALGTATARPAVVRARLPAGRWELEALSLQESSGLEITNGHQNGENPAASTQFAGKVTLGPLTAADLDGRPLMTVSVNRWRAVGAASTSGPASTAGNRLQPTRTTLLFQTTGFPGVLRPTQPSDTRPVPVLVDPRTAASAGPGERLELTVDELPVLARIVGILRRFPTVTAGAAGFVVADQANLSSALDAQLPGQGRPDELWIASTHSARLRAALRAGSLAQLSSAFRLDIERGLQSAPVARSVLRALIVAAALTGLLAVLGLLLALLGVLRDRFTERDLEVQGVGPRGLRSELRTRLTLAAALGVLGGLAIALLLTRLAVATVAAAGTVSNPQPALVTVVPWTELLAWVLGTAVVLCLAGWLATRWAIKGARPRGAGGSDWPAEREDSLAEVVAR